MRIVLSENFRAVFYAPFYACLSLGFFRDQGLEVELLASPSPGAGIAAMLQGTTHLVWGGPLRVLKDRDDAESGPNSLVAFGEVAARDPFFLVGRTELKPFDLGRLTGLKLSTVSEVPTPWLCLQEDLRDRGLDPAQIDRVADRSMADNLQALAEARADVIQVFEPWVSAAETEGVGVPLHAGHERGYTAYTSFISTRAHLDRYDGPFRAMAKALCAFPDWLAAEGSAGLARVVRDFYPHVDSILLERSLRRYQKADLWSCRPEISRDGFARLARSMLHSGFIEKITPYETCVAPWAHEQTV